MSIRQLAELTETLPRVTRDDVMGYARSVERVLPGIFRDARVRYEEQLASDLVFLAGVKRLYEVVSSTYWLADNSLAATGRNERPTEAAVVGSLVLRRGTGFHRAIGRLLGDLEEVLSELELRGLIRERSLTVVLRELADGH